MKREEKTKQKTLTECTLHTLYVLVFIYWEQNFIPILHVCSEHNNCKQRSFVSSVSVYWCRCPFLRRSISGVCVNVVYVWEQERAIGRLIMWVISRIILKNIRLEKCSCCCEIMSIYNSPLYLRKRESKR